MSRVRLFTALVLLTATTSMDAQRPASPVAPLPSFGEPAISPDRGEIAFISGADIWTVPASGGEARLLVSHPASESRPLYAPDGRTLAFVSDRSGGGDIYLVTLATGVLRQLTFDDGIERLDGWSRDGTWIYFSSTSRDIAGMNDLFRVRAVHRLTAGASRLRLTATAPRSGGAMAARTSTNPKSG